MKANNRYNVNAARKDCQYCGKAFSLPNINKHEKTCKSNPARPIKPVTLKECPNCKVMHSKSGVTCSYSCSNTYFRGGANPEWKYKSYRAICFQAHGKKCLVCEETKIVTAHHLNEDHDDNRPENLVPLCPTHHQYVHSRYRNEVQPIIDRYVESLK